MSRTHKFPYLGDENAMSLSSPLSMWWSLVCCWPSLLSSSSTASSFTLRRFCWVSDVSTRSLLIRLLLLSLRWIFMCRFRLLDNISFWQIRHLINLLSSPSLSPTFFFPTHLLFFSQALPPMVWDLPEIKNFQFYFNRLNNQALTAQIIIFYEIMKILWPSKKSYGLHCIYIHMYKLVCPRSCHVSRAKIEQHSKLSDWLFSHIPKKMWRQSGHLHPNLAWSSRCLFRDLGFRTFPHNLQARKYLQFIFYTNFPFIKKSDLKFTWIKMQLRSAV